MYSLTCTPHTCLHHNRVLQKLQWPAKIAVYSTQANRLLRENIHFCGLAQQGKKLLLATWNFSLWLVQNFGRTVILNSPKCWAGVWSPILICRWHLIWMIFLEKEIKFRSKTKRESKQSTLRCINKLLETCSHDCSLLGYSKTWYANGGPLFLSLMSAGTGFSRIIFSDY